MNTKQAAPVLSQILGTFPELSGGHKKVARFVLDHHRDAALMGIEQLAHAAGVSIATVTRFARVLGYDGFPVFRQELVGLLKEVLAPVQKMRIAARDPASDGAFVQAEIEEDITNLRVMLRTLDPRQVDRCVRLLLKAPRVLLLWSGSGALARFAYHHLSPYLRHVELLDPSGVTLFGPLLTVTRGDLLLVCSFPRHGKHTMDAVRLGKEKGATIIAITDSSASPIVEFANECFFTPCERAQSGSSITPALALLDALCAATVRHTEDAGERMAQLTECMLPYLHRGS